MIRDRYTLHPGRSRSGRWIGPRALAKLYGVEMRDCMVAPTHRPLSRAERQGKQLRVRTDGAYRKPDGSPNVPPWPWESEEAA